MERKHQRCLGTDGDQAVLSDEAGTECLCHILRELAVACGLPRFPDGVAHIRQQTGAIPEIGGANEFGRSLDLGERKPVTVVGDRANKVVRGSLLEAHPAFHHFEVLANDARIPVAHPKGPRDDGRGVRPGGGTVTALEDVWANRGNLPVFELGFAHVTQVLPQEIVRIKIAAGGAAEDFRVPRPSQTLIPLRAVNGDVEEVPPLSPDDVFVETVEFGVTALEGAGPVQIRRENNAGHLNIFDWIGGELESVNLDIAESVEGECRLVCGGFGTGVVVVGADGASVVEGVEGAILVEHFCETEGIEAVSAQFHPDVTGDVLPQVPNPDIVPWMKDLDRLDGGDFTHRRGNPRGHGRHVDGFAQGHRRPSVVRRAGGIPAGHLQTRIVEFAVVDIACQDGACANLPSVSGADSAG